MILAKALEQRDRLEQKIKAEWECRFPSGKIVSFKRGNMTDYDEAEVLFARFWHTPELRVRNLRTGKEREISYTDLSPSCKTDGDSEEAA